ncbi:hypothetical protein RUND412_009737 [Rhizina undulata]
MLTFLLEAFVIGLKVLLTVSSCDQDPCFLMMELVYLRLGGVTPSVFETAAGVLCEDAVEDGGVTGCTESSHESSPEPSPAAHPNPQYEQAAPESRPLPPDLQADPPKTTKNSCEPKPYHEPYPIPWKFRYKVFEPPHPSTKPAKQPNKKVVALEITPPPPISEGSLSRIKASHVDVRLPEKHWKGLESSFEIETVQEQVQKRGLGTGIRRDLEDAGHSGDIRTLRTLWPRRYVVEHKEKPKKRFRIPSGGAGKLPRPDS